MPSELPRDPELEARAINVVRGLAMDAPHKAKSGHQGTAMALAPLAHVLYTRIMKYDASAPDWADRDRFILSAGHASILQYAYLHLTGFGLEKQDLEDFRQWGSLTPGHPEVHHTAGVEVTTGPLGQGIANGVGMAIAEQSLRARFGADVCDHRIYAICGDGDLSEGVSHEAASLAGHLGLGRLIYVYDDNRITIDGPTDIALSDDAAMRFRAYGWQVIEVGEAAEDLDAIEAALREGAANEEQPTLIIMRSHIAFPSPTHQDTPAAHGLAFKDETIAEAKRIMGLPEDEAFFIPEDVLEYYRAAGVRQRDVRAAWEAGLDAALGSAEARSLYEASVAGRGVEGWAGKLPTYSPGESVATRVALSAALNSVLDVVPGLVAGGADLTGNTGTNLKGVDTLSRTAPGGRQIAFGVREHAMGSALVGAALHGGVTPVGGTFLVFSDYMRPAARLAALSRAKCIFSWTHDSVGVGEDGPTHQPVEHIAALRAIPDLLVLRPADANETVAAVRVALDHDGPTALILSRQNLPVLEGTSDEGVARGGYVLREASSGAPAAVIVATGSEVSVALAAADELEAAGTATRVVSLPSWELFEAQDAAARAEVLPEGVPTVSVEAGVTFGWARYAQAHVGIDRFGASAPGDVVLRELGINPGNVVATVNQLLGKA